MVSIAPFVIVIGPAKHGKSTFRRALAAKLGTKGASCSDMLYAIWAYVAEESEEGLRKRPKDEIRSTLVALGDWYTTPAATLAENFPFDKLPSIHLAKLEGSEMEKPHEGVLIQQAYRSGVRVLDGVRRKRELAAALPIFKWVGIPVLVLYVYDPRKGVDPTDNFDLRYRDANNIILNNGSEENLEAEAARVAEIILRESGLDAYTHITQ
jgi:hypothetical protein